MILTEALKEIEATLTSGSKTPSGSILAALECVVETAIPQSSSRQTGGYDYEESEYAVEVALNLSKRSDPCYQTYFKALSDLGVSIEGVHNRDASRS